MFKILSTRNYTTSRIPIWLQSRTCLNLCWSIQGLFLICTIYLISEYARLAHKDLVEILMMRHLCVSLYMFYLTHMNLAKSPRS